MYVPSTRLRLGEKRLIHSGPLREEFGPNELLLGWGGYEAREGAQAARILGIPSG
jgi:hypothetical protein